MILKSILKAVKVENSASSILNLFRQLAKHLKVFKKRMGFPGLGMTK